MKRYRIDGTHVRTRSAKRVLAHPRAVAVLPGGSEIASAPDQPFARGVKDTLSPDLRHRLVSETAFHHLAERGYGDGSEVDDWAQAEAEIDHTLLKSPEDET